MTVLVYIHKIGALVSSITGMFSERIAQSRFGPARHRASGERLFYVPAVWSSCSSFKLQPEHSPRVRTITAPRPHKHPRVCGYTSGRRLFHKLVSSLVHTSYVIAFFATPRLYMFLCVMRNVHSCTAVHLCLCTSSCVP